MALAYVLTDAERTLLKPWLERRLKSFYKEGKPQGDVRKTWLTSQSKLEPGCVKLNAEVYTKSKVPGICHIYLRPGYVMGGCSCLASDDPTQACAHILLLAAALLETKPAELSAFAQEVEQRLGISLDPHDQYFIRCAENMFLLKVDSMPAAELLPPQKRLGVDRFNSIKPWKETARPTSLWEALLLLHEAAGQAGLSPKNLGDAIPESAVQELVELRNRPQIIEQWVRRCQELPAPRLSMDAEPVELEPYSLALAIMLPKSLSQPFCYIVRRGSLEVQSRRALAEYETALLQNYDRFDPASRFLALEVLRSLDGTGSLALGRIVPVLNGLLRLDVDLTGAIVSSAGKKLVWHTTPLEWQLEFEEGAKQDLLLKLMSPEGVVVPGSLYIARNNREIFYFTQDQVWPIKRYPFDEKLSWPQRIPLEVIASPAGQRLFKALGKEPPGELKERYRDIQPTIRLRFYLTSATEQLSTDVCMEALADYEGYGPNRKYENKGWTDQPFAPNPANQDLLIRFDRSREQGVLDWLKDLGWLYYRGNWQSEMGDSDAVEDFVVWLEERPQHIQITLEGELAGLLSQGSVDARYKINVSKTKGNEQDWFDIDVALDTGDVSLTPQEISLLQRYMHRWVRLPGKGYHRLDSGPTKEDMEELARLGLGVSEDGQPLVQRMHTLQLAQAAASDLLEEKFRKDIKQRAQKGVDLSIPALPTAVQATLRPYQKEGFDFLCYLSKNNFGGVLADDMGLGKTLQTLAWIAWLKEKDPALGAVLVICPKSVVENWLSEAARFVPSLRVQVWTSATAGDLSKIAELDLLIINHAQLRLREAELTAHTWRAVVIDEAQAIKTPQSQTSLAAAALKAPYRLALTGTPIENRLLDLWSIFRFALPGLLGSRAQFTKAFEGKNDRFARLRLSSRLRPFLLRRTKSEVAKDLPDRIEEDLTVELEGPQRKLYEAELKRAQIILLKLKSPKELDKARFSILASLMKLRQICCDTRLLDKNTVPTSKKKPSASTSSAKLQALMEQIEPILERGEKILVFSQFVEMLDLIHTDLKAAKVDTFLLTGKTEDRGSLVQKFQAHEGGAVFLISLKAGGSGLNLTAASYVVIYDPWWNPAVENQAIDRTHRIGQKNTVFAYRLVAKDTIEEKIRLLQQSKAALAADVLGEESFAQALTKDDFQFLFS